MNQTFRVAFLLTYTGDPPTSVDGAPQIMPTTFALAQNYPNPFNPSTAITFTLPKSAHMTLTVTDVLGRNISTLVDEERAAGIHITHWNASSLPSGVYFLRMVADGFVDTKKMLLQK